MKKLNIVPVLFSVLLLILPPVFAEGQQQGKGAQGNPFSGGASPFNSSFGGSGSAGSSGADTGFTTVDEYYLGRAVAANILGLYRPYTSNTALTAYVNRICQVIAINSSRPDIYNGYHVLILDSAEFNAFASPGGHILITRGLVEAAPSEDALAGVIAHEFAHIQLKHGINIIKEMEPFSEADAIASRAADFNRKFGSAAGAAASDKIMNYRSSVMDIITTMVKNGYSQDQEFEADSTALALLAAAGYNPSGLRDMLQILQRVQAGQRGGFNTTHPRPTDRLTRVNPLLGRYRVTDTSSYRASRFKNK